MLDSKADEARHAIYEEARKALHERLGNDPQISHDELVNGGSLFSTLKLNLKGKRVRTLSAMRRAGLRPTWRSWRSWCGTRAIRPYFIAKGGCRLVKAAVETECAEFPARKNRQPSCRRQASQPFGPTIFFAGLTNNATQCGEWRTRTCDSLYYMEF
jgi:hypothetical protein